MTKPWKKAGSIIPSNFTDPFLDTWRIYSYTFAVRKLTSLIFFGMAVVWAGLIPFVWSQEPSGASVSDLLEAASDTEYSEDAASRFIFGSSKIESGSDLISAETGFVSSENEGRLPQIHFFSERMISHGLRHPGSDTAELNPLGVVSADLYLAPSPDEKMELKMIFSFLLKGGIEKEEEATFVFQKEEAAAFLGSPLLRDLRVLFSLRVSKAVQEAEKMSPDFQTRFDPYLGRSVQELLIEMQTPFTAAVRDFDKTVQSLKKLSPKPSLTLAGPKAESQKKSSEDLSPAKPVEWPVSAQIQTQPSVPSEPAVMPAFVPPVIGAKESAELEWKKKEPEIEEAFFEALLVQYAELRKTREGLKSGTPEFLKISQDMGRIKQDLQTAGYFSLSREKKEAMELSAIEKSSETSVV